MKHLLLFLGLALVIASCDKSDAGSTDSLASSSSAGGKGGSLARFTIIGNYLYVADVWELKTYNITNPSAATEVSTTQLSFSAETIFPFENKLYIGGSAGLQIFSLVDPVHPASVGFATHLRSCDPVVANDSIAFVTLLGNQRCGPATDGLYTYRASNLQLINLTPLSTPLGLGIADSVLYVCRQANGMSVFNVTQPSQPILRKTISSYNFKDVIPYGNLLICYVSNGIALYDISARANPVFITEILN